MRGIYIVFFTMKTSCKESTLYFNARILHCIFHDEDVKQRWRVCIVFPKVNENIMQGLFVVFYKQDVARTLCRISHTPVFHGRRHIVRVAGTTIRLFQVRPVWISKCVSVAALLHLATTALLLQLEKEGRKKETNKEQKESSLAKTKSILQR